MENIKQQQQNEIWKTIRGFEKYKVSSFGKVRGQRKILKAVVGKKGYNRVSLYTNTGKLKNKLVHRLVALHFLPPFPEHLEINHIDRNKSNNSWYNLESVTKSENMLHRYQTKPPPRPLPYDIENDVRYLLKRKGSNPTQIAHVLEIDVRQVEEVKRKTLLETYSKAS